MYAYTGEGVRGDPNLLRGNQVLISSVQDGRLIRLVTVCGVDAAYIGAFTLCEPPFDYRQVPDVDGPMRCGIILLLASVDANIKSLPIQDMPEMHTAVIADWIQ